MNQFGVSIVRTLITPDHMMMIVGESSMLVGVSRLVLVKNK